MINKLKDMELDYIRCFSKEKHNDGLIEFYDNKFKNTYTGNVTVLKNNLENNKLLEIINNEVKGFKRRGKYFLNFEINEEINESLTNNLTLKPKRIDTFDYLIIRSEKYKKMMDQKDTELKEVRTKEDYKNLIDISVKDNMKIVGYSYSMQRIKRKIQVYKDDNNDLKVYICFYKNKPIGSYEILVKDKICKIEDFGILKEYRGKGFGTHILRSILKDNYENGIEYTYLIAEKNGDAERLYKKLGFIKSGEKTQFIWQ